MSQHEHDLLAPSRLPLIRKGSGAIQISNNLSLLSRKFYNVLLMVALPDLTHRREFTIPIATLKHALKLSSKNDEHIEGAMLALMTQVVEWALIEPDTGKPILRTTTLLAQVDRDGSLFTFQFSDGLAERLANPSQYGMINIGQTANFSTRYTMALYENATPYIGQFSPVIPTSTFYRLLGLSENIAWKDVNSQFIKPAIEEIRRHTGMAIEVGLQKAGRGGKVVGVKIRAALDVGHAVNDQLDLEMDAMDEGLVFLLSDQYGFAPKAARMLVIGYDNERIRQVLAALEMEINKGTAIRRKAGWITNALRNVWTFGDLPDTLVRAVGRRVRSPEQANRKELIDRFKTLSDSERQSVLDVFLAHPENAVFRGKNMTSLLRSSPFRNAFGDFLAERMTALTGEAGRPE